MTHFKITIVVDGTVIRVRGRGASRLVRQAGLRPIFSGIDGGAWLADTTRLPDLVAYLQYRNVPVKIIKADPVAAPDEGHQDPTGGPTGGDRGPKPQAALFGGDSR